MNDRSHVNLLKSSTNELEKEKKKLKDELQQKFNTNSMLDAKIESIEKRITQKKLAIKLCHDEYLKQKADCQNAELKADQLKSVHFEKRKTLEDMEKMISMEKEHHMKEVVKMNNKLYDTLNSLKTLKRASTNLFECKDMLLGEMKQESDSIEKECIVSNEKQKLKLQQKLDEHLQLVEGKLPDNVKKYALHVALETKDQLKLEEDKLKNRF